MCNCNFRSDKEVINSINFIFENLMSKKIGDIDYNNEERLVFGYDEIKTNQDPNTNCFNIKLIDTSEKKIWSQHYHFGLALWITDF